MGAACRIREKAVVVAAAATKARAIAGEGEAGDEDDVESGNVEALTLEFRFPDVHRAALKVIKAFDSAWMEFSRVDLKQYQASSLGIESGEKMRKEVGFTFEATEEGYGGAWGPRSGEMQNVVCDFPAGGGDESGIEGTEAFAQVLAKRGFVVHGLL